MKKALNILKKLVGVSNKIHIDIELLEAKEELEEHIKEDIYMLNKIEDSLSMGNKAQSLATVEVYQILKNRNKDKNENNNI